MKNLDAIPGDASPASSSEVHLGPQVVGDYVVVAAGNYALMANRSDYAAVERKDSDDLAEDTIAEPVDVGYRSLRG